MINIAVITTTRAEYGLMKQILYSFEKDKSFKLSLIVSGTHLLKEYGYTINEIIEDKIPIEKKIKIIVKNGNAIDVNKTISNAITKFSYLFLKNKYDYIFVDGDRYEMLGVCIAAVNSGVPIIHCGGGAKTEGAKDEYWRHAITKLSYIHLVTNDQYRERVIRMGENPENVFNVGSPGIENIKNIKYKTKTDIEKRIKMKLTNDFALVTFHPSSNKRAIIKKEVRELIKAFNYFNKLQFIITKSNADAYGEIINEEFGRYVSKNIEKAVMVPSLGTTYYLSIMKICNFVIGNSSSGIIETPSFKKPTINIGDRQKGRLQAKNIINCKPCSLDIISSIERALDFDFVNYCKTTKNPYGDGKTSKRIKEIIIKDSKKNIDRSIKVFYDTKNEKI